MKRTTDLPLGQDPQFIKSLFASISENYDRANDVMTFGLARLWRRQLVQWSRAKAGDSVLDCATGTGDLALEFKRILGPTSRVVGSDFCEDMLKHAPRKAFDRGLEMEFVVADAMALPFQDASFNVTSIAYGIRNVADPVRALREMARVTVPGGSVMILETGSGQWPVLKPLMRLYFENIVPRMGGLVTGHKSAYEYLNRSSGQFPSRHGFVDMMMSTGKFASVEYRSLLGGASFLYRARTQS